MPAVPFLWCGILAAGLVGRTGVARWIGGRVMPEKAPGNRLEAARSLGIGLAACTLVYMVPVLGLRHLDSRGSYRARGSCDNVLR